MDINDIIKRPHDTLFKRTLLDKSVAMDFIKNYLPQEILNKVDLTDIKIAKDSFVDENLKESFSDILYNVKIEDRDGYIYLLFEHKSYHDIMVPIQLLKYLTEIWSLHKKQFGRRQLPIIIPILIYHGDEKWKQGSSLSNILEEPPVGLEKYVPEYSYLVYDFSDYTDAEIKGEIKLRLFLKLISHIFNEDFDKGLREVIPLLNKLVDQVTGLDYVETVVKYILNTTDGISLEELEKKTSEISLEGRKIFMTIAEQLVKEGEQKGLEKGLEKGMEKGMEKELMDTVRVLIKKKFNTELRQDIEKRIETANKRSLIEIRDNIFEINSLEEVEQILKK